MDKRKESEKEAEQRRQQSLLESRLAQYPHPAMVEVDPDTKTHDRLYDRWKDMTLDVNPKISGKGTN